MVGPRAAHPLLLMTFAILCGTTLSSPAAPPACSSSQWRAVVQPGHEVTIYPAETVALSRLTFSCLLVNVTAECSDFVLVLNNSAQETHVVARQPGEWQDLNWTSSSNVTWWLGFTNAGTRCATTATVAASTVDVPLHCPARCSGHGYCDIADPTSACRCTDDSSGHWAGIACETCASGFSGPQCLGPITCNLQHGRCTSGSCSGPLGDGHCSDCDDHWWGIDCSNPVSCDTAVGRCEPASCHGTTGNGHCNSCDQRFFGPDCRSSVTCQNGTCPVQTCNGPTGNGLCASCVSPYLGANCDVKAQCVQPNAALCQEGSCYGVNASGHCDMCQPMFYGANCAEQIKCNRERGGCSPGKCYDVNGNGLCDSCFPFYYGPTCEPVNCNIGPGMCNAGDCYGTTGTGNCSACEQGAYGPLCTNAVTCSTTGGVCQSKCFGIHGTGHCDACKPDHYGLDCAPVRCNTSAGVCNEGTCQGVNGTGKCDACTVNFFGPECKPITCNTSRGTCSPGECDGATGDGHCHGGCSEGWKGEDCSEEQNLWEKHWPMLVSAGGGAFVVFAAGGLVFFVCVRTRRARALAQNDQLLTSWSGTDSPASDWHLQDHPSRKSKPRIISDF
eukprot:TRINITY_DN25253_c0_g1_i1.p1 TRINITY_DN25253_c0_g1~~TRINITY_DN25253_c0_g1_i1.p1  ORF type:complete len:630 (+),score=15.30 TRINITY_DN25253_c0_g1_i1:49-1890(+)